MDDALPLQLIQAIGLPLFVCSLAAVVTLKWHLASTRTTALVFAGLLMASALAAAWWLVNKALSRANHYLGYYGERVVAELLEPLRAQGWHIFHDVQAQVGKERFNVDHVAIGSGGFFAIETKTRRKGHAIKGREDYKVFYDGKKLLWPWGDEEPYGVDKAIYRAKWLETWLKAATGENIEVKPVLTFPEWYVKETVVDPRLRVVTSSWLPDVTCWRVSSTSAVGTSSTEDQVLLCPPQLQHRPSDAPARRKLTRFENGWRASSTRGGAPGPLSPPPSAGLTSSPPIIGTASTAGATWRKAKTCLLNPRKITWCRRPC